jgi:hypothetical protein
MQWLTKEADANVAQAEANGRFQHLDHHVILIERGDAAELGRLAFAQDLDRFVQAGLDIAPQEQERPFDRRRRALH